MVLGWLMCSSAFSQSPTRVVMDAWFNSHQRTNAAGQEEYFRYKWSDVSNSGLFLFGQIFRGFGVATDTLYSAPTVANLKGAQFYIIVSPDIPVENPPLITCSPRMRSKWLNG
jgi:unsaturated rhamnogalacturonyl hydrolase